MTTNPQDLDPQSQSPESATAIDNVSEAPASDNPVSEPLAPATTPAGPDRQGSDELSDKVNEDLSPDPQEPQPGTEAAEMRSDLPTETPEAEEPAAESTPVSLRSDDTAEDTAAVTAEPADDEDPLAVRIEAEGEEEPAAEGSGG